MIRTKLWILSAVCLSAATALAQPETNAYTTEIMDPPPKYLFRANEFSLDVFGTVSIDQETIDDISGDAIEDNGDLGAGIGVNYFVTRMLGFGADAFSQNTDGPFIDNTSVNLILRIPIDSIHLAPYVYGGGGYQFDPGEVWFGQVGAGLEFRFCPHVALFSDARYVMTDGIENFGMGRFGLRFVF